MFGGWGSWTSSEIFTWSEAALALGRLAPADVRAALQEWENHAESVTAESQKITQRMLPVDSFAMYFWCWCFIDPFPRGHCAERDPRRTPGQSGTLILHGSLVIYKLLREAIENDLNNSC